MVLAARGGGGIRLTSGIPGGMLCIRGVYLPAGAPVILFTKLDCSREVADKLWSKHAVDVREVRQALEESPYKRRGAEGLANVLGQTQAGRYLSVLVRELGNGRVRVVTARDMTRAERRLYERR